MPYISFIVAFIASECIKYIGKAYGAALCILSFTACLLKPQSILNFKGRFAFVSKSILLVFCCFHLNMFSYFQDIFMNLCQLDGEKYFMCNLDDFKFLADMIEHVPLSLRVRYVFCCAPIPRKQAFVCSLFLKVNIYGNDIYTNNSIQICGIYALSSILWHHLLSSHFLSGQYLKNGLTDQIHTWHVDVTGPEGVPNCKVTLNTQKYSRTSIIR